MITLLSTWTQEYQSLADLTWTDNKERYANKHGYNSRFIIHQNSNDLVWDRPRMWLKILNELPDDDWLLFTGTDVIITQPAYKIEDYIPVGCDLVCGVDYHDVFGDCLLIRACTSTRHLLSEILRLKDQFPNEQVALSVLLSGLINFESYRIGAGDDFGTHEFYERSHKLLNGSNVRIHLHNPLQAKKMIGDLNWVHDCGLWRVPPYHTWYNDTFMLHLGGKPLHFRLGLLPWITKNIVWN